jgi:hypothetical protein
MGKLVSDHGKKEQQRCYKAGHPVNRRGLIRESPRKVPSRETEENQAKYNKPRIVEPELYTLNREKRQAGFFLVVKGSHETSEPMKLTVYDSFGIAASTMPMPKQRANEIIGIGVI